MSLRKSAIFVGCARNCEPYIDRVLANIGRAASQFTEVAFVFVENNSVDSTADRLRNFGKNWEHFFLEQLPGLDARCPRRTERLAIARNHYMDVIRQSTMRNHEYLFVFDMDEINSLPLVLGNLMGALHLLDSAPDHAAVFANQFHYYYDMYALRHHQLCPMDPWEEVFDYVRSHRVSDQAAFDATYAKRMMSIDPHQQTAIEVESAFGGLGVYRTSYAIDGVYCGSRSKTIIEDGRERNLQWQVCEHVSFHSDIRSRGGRLLIAPWLVNCQFTPLKPGEAVPFSPSQYRSLYRFID
jgi:hypothetical protein